MSEKDLRGEFTLKRFAKRKALAYCPINCLEQSDIVNMVIWLIGVSGAGKTTIGTKLCEKLKENRSNWVFLDGDNLREVWGGELGHSISDREINAKRISKLCHLLDKQDINVIASVLSIFPSWQDWNRENLSSYFEVYVKADINTVIDRDTKGLYEKAIKGKLKNVVGIDIKFPEPVKADVVIDTSNSYETPEISTDRILSLINQKLSRNFREG